jgi:hypothetical protein
MAALRGGACAHRRSQPAACASPAMIMGMQAAMGIHVAQLAAATTLLLLAAALPTAVATKTGQPHVLFMLAE